MEKFFLNITKKYPKITNFFLLFLVIILTFSLVRNLKKILSIQDQIEREKNRVVELKKESEELKREVEKITSDTHIEKQFRDKLGLAREGEYVVILPDEEVVRKLAPKFVFEEKTRPLENWRKWLLLFQ